MQIGADLEREGDKVLIYKQKRTGTGSSPGWMMDKELRAIPPRNGSKANACAYQHRRRRKRAALCDVCGAVRLRFYQRMDECVACDLRSHCRHLLERIVSCDGPQPRRRMMH